MTNEHVIFTVEDMRDDPCAATIRDALLRLNGVEDVMADVGMKRVAVEYDSERMQLDTLRGTIEDEGFKVR